MVRGARTIEGFVELISKEKPSPCSYSFGEPDYDDADRVPPYHFLGDGFVIYFLDSINAFWFPFALRAFNVYEFVNRAFWYSVYEGSPPVIVDDRFHALRAAIYKYKLDIKVVPGFTKNHIIEALIDLDNVMEQGWQFSQPNKSIITVSEDTSIILNRLLKETD